MPKKEKIISLLRSSLLFGGLVFLLSYPNLYFFTHRVFVDQIQAVAWDHNVSVRWFLFTQASTLIFLLFLCSFCGFAFSKRYDLKEFGNVRELGSMGLRIYLPLALGLALLSYFIFDRWFISLAPEFYPTNFFWALTIPFRTAFLEETVFRFGMVTVGVGAFRRFLHPLWAVFVVSVFYAWVISQKTVELVGIPWTVNPQTAILASTSFFMSFLLGFIYWKKGLSHSLFLHFLLGLKYPFLSFF